MQGANWTATIGLWTTLGVFSMGGAAAAGAIPSYARVVDLGLPSTLTNIEYPSINNDGNVVSLSSGSAGAYTAGRVFDTVSGALGQPLYNYLYKDGGNVNLLPRSLQDTHSLITGLNASGHTVGYAFGPGASDSHPSFFFSAETGRIMYPQSLQGATQPPILNAINSSDQMVGFQDSKAVFYASPTSEPIELSTLLPTSSGWRFINATGINDRGEIVGYGVNPSGKLSDFKLEPSAVPEPTTLASFLLVGLAVGARRFGRRRGVTIQGR